MNMLIQWVTQIIVFLLLAAIIDLLIPANSMKKYVKFVIGLILIMIFLQPVFYLFQIDIKQAIGSAFNAHFQKNGVGDSIGNLIELKKNEIESSQNAYILEQLAVQFTDLAKDELQEKYQAEIVDIQFEFVPETDYSYENLETVTVQVKEQEAGEGAVNAVNDVVININEPIEPKEKKETEGIEKLLQEVWQLGDKQLRIVWEGGAS